MGTVITLTSLNNVPLLTSVDLLPLMKTAGVVTNSGHCLYSIGLNFFSLFHLVIYIYIYIVVFRYWERPTSNYGPSKADQIQYLDIHIYISQSILPLSFLTYLHIVLDIF